MLVFKMTENRNFSKEILNLKDDFTFIYGKIIEKLDEMEEIQKANPELIEENQNQSVKHNLLFRLHTKEKQITLIEREKSILTYEKSCIQNKINEKKDGFNKLKDSIDKALNVLDGVLNNCQ